MGDSFSKEQNTGEEGKAESVPGWGLLGTYSMHTHMNIQGAQTQNILDLMVHTHIHQIETDTPLDPMSPCTDWASSMLYASLSLGTFWSQSPALPFHSGNIVSALKRPWSARQGGTFSPWYEPTVPCPTQLVSWVASVPRGGGLSTGLAGHGVRWVQDTALWGASPLLQWSPG